MYGEWCSPEGIVYPEYDPSVHDVEEEEIDIKHDWIWTAACDHGFNHPFVFHLYCGPKDRSRLYLYKEIYKSGLDVDETRMLVKHLLDQHLPSNKDLLWTVADHRPEINKTIEKLGIRVESAEKEVLQGIQTVRDYLQAQKIFFNKNSLTHAPDLKRKEAGNPIRTVEEFERYSYKDESKMDGSDRDEIPIKSFDDGLYTTRYELVKWSTQPKSYVDFTTTVTPKQSNKFF